MYRILLLLALFSFMALPSRADRTVIPLNSDWKFRFAHQVSGPPQRVELPHTWNTTDALSGDAAYYRGTGIYEKSISLPDKPEGARVYIRFGGVNHTATIFIDSRYVGKHEGGYGAFTFDITDYLTPDTDHTLTVKANNALDLSIMPLVGDFNMYGGIYRGVDLIVAPPLHISTEDYASPGVYIHQREVSHTEAYVDVDVLIRNASSRESDGVMRVAVLKDGHQVAGVTRSVSLAPDTTEIFSAKSLHIVHPRLWNGREDPYMYTVVAEVLSEEGEVMDRVEQPLGLRYFSIDAERGFMLNGKPLRLHGVCRHQDRAERGNALLPAHHREDADIIEEMGANAVRLAHYPQAKEFYDLMDEKGIIVWAEIPFIGPGGYYDRGYNAIPEFEENGERQLREMIRQHYNHPSICMWGLFNELKTHGDNPLRYVRKLNETAHQEDPYRPTTAASFLDASDSINSVTDLIAWNKYFGWYDGQPSDMGRWLNRTHAAFPNYKIGISEYGAGASVYHQQDSVKRGSPAGWWHPENYQTFYHMENWKAIAERPFVWGSFVWNMFDFGAAHRTEGDRPGINDKGLVTFDRKIKKDAFYFYKANWNKSDPFVYIADRRNDRRESPATTVTIFTNQPEAELIVNGKSYGIHRADDYATITINDVRLAPGRNTVEARCPANPLITDSVTWTLPR